MRFGAGPLFRRVGYRRVISMLVATSASFVAILWFPTTFVPLALTFAAIGMARGILRVASGALAVEGSEGERAGGGASGVYLAGLDLGNVLGPLAGGVAAELVGLRAVFPMLGATFAATFAVLAIVLRRRTTGRSATA